MAADLQKKPFDYTENYWKMRVSEDFVEHVVSPELIHQQRFEGREDLVGRDVSNAGSSAIVDILPMACGLSPFPTAIGSHPQPS